ncbi:hypothetical protein Niako_7175 [Niastella koreensis GR20-10]|uniref:Uncharacterized protein n=2 Tax=Niastella koreensis TaxID=354356 RepID=G8T7U8_NIAKG|nr:hypothetical protein [Niastella koreensis]AEW03392.1 hypothetical protein Niako_7175 [Niastella koreensis GR20-10]
MSVDKLINQDKYNEIQYLDELMRELQKETLNEDWGYWHFSLLNLEDGEDLTQRIYNTLIELPKYKNPYLDLIDKFTGSRTYISSWDLKNLTLETVTDLKNEFVKQADHYAYYQGPSKCKQIISERFHSLKYEVADKISVFLQSKEISANALVCGIDTCYSFGGDHCGDDILVDTRAGVYVIHFGFSS